MKTKKTTEKTDCTTYSRLVAQTVATFIFAGLLVLPIPAWSQTPEWTVYNTGNSGLPNNFVCNVAIDVHGNIWTSTFGSGVAKFDGQNWIIYNRTNSGLPHNDVCVVQADGRENVWAGTRAGLVTSDGTHWTVYDRSNSGLPDDNVYCIAFDAEGDIWIGTQDGGLVLFRPRPVVDFNGNGTVDINDLVHLIESWGQDDRSCDVGPVPFGDGIVDRTDLEVLMSYWGQEVQDSTLIAHWKFDEAEGFVAHDSAGDHDGTLIGPGLWRPEGGRCNGALELDGTYFAVANSVLNPPEGPFSVFAWVKGGAPGQAILSQQTGVNWLALDPVTGALMTELRSGGRFSTVLSSDAIIADGNWHRVGFTWDHPVRRLYVDAALVAEDTDVGLGECYGGMNLGSGSTMAPATFFAGLIDDVRIYNRAVKP